MADVFVSYATPDRETAFRIAEFLEAQGISCWIAPRDVGPGQDYGAAIIAAIEASSVLVLILSEQSNSSPYVQKEVERAVSKAKPVLPVRIREVVPSGSLEFFVSSAQWVDAWRSPMEQHLARLAEAILTITGDGAPSAPARPVPPPRRRGRRHLFAAGAAAAGVAAVVAGLVVWAPWQAPWQRSVPGFLAGSWCEPMSGDAFVRTDFVVTGADAVAGEMHYSHHPRIDRFQAATRRTDDGFELVWTAPPEMTEAAPARFRVLGDASMEMMFGKEAEASLVTRCSADSGN